MSELIQVKKQVTFEELCPKWSKSIQTGKLEDGLGSAFECCIVGEAHGFSSSYRCGTCVFSANDLVNIEGSTASVIVGIGFRPSGLHREISSMNEELFEQRKAAFMKHWNDKHVSGNLSDIQKL